MKLTLICAIFVQSMVLVVAQSIQCGVCPTGRSCDYNTGLCQQFRQTAQQPAVLDTAQRSSTNQQPSQYQPAPQQYQPAPQQYQPAPQQYQPAPQQYRPAPQQYQPAPQQYYPAPQPYQPQQPPTQYQPAPAPCQACQPTNNPTCPLNSHYTNCGSACPLRCDQINSGVCNMMCVAGCVCNDFYVQISAVNKTCVRRESCPAPTPGYNDCTRIGCSYGQVCVNKQCVPMTAATTKAPISCPYSQPATLPPGCMYQTSTDSNGCRVQKLVCPESGQCGGNSTWAECYATSATCYRYCDPSSTIMTTCSATCQRGCVCNQGFVFQTSNQSLGCIPENQCTARQDPCSYLQCGYGQTCSGGKCVASPSTPPTQCPLPDLAPLPEGCMYQPSVESNGCRLQKLVCPDQNPCASKQCGTGLVCNNGQCVPPVAPAGPPPALPPSMPDSCPYTPQTPVPSGCKFETSYDGNGCRVQKLVCTNCGENEEEKICLVCDQYCDKSVKMCTIECPKSTHCACKSGYFRNASEKCVLKEQC